LIAKNLMTTMNCSMTTMNCSMKTTKDSTTMTRMIVKSYYSTRKMRTKSWNCLTNFGWTRMTKN